MTNRRHLSAKTIGICALLLATSATHLWAGSAAWDSTIDASWNVDGNWNPNTDFPDGQGETATFGSGGFAGTGETRTISVDTAVTVGSLIFQASGANNGYLITGPQAITLDVAAGNATITSTLSGSNPHEIHADVEIDDPVNVTGGNFPSLIVFGSMSGTVGNPDVTVNKLDISTLTLRGDNDFGNGTVNLNSGSITLSPTAVGTNTIGGGSDTTIHLNGGSLTLAGIGTGGGSSAGVNSYQTNVQIDAATATLTSTRNNGGYQNEVNEIDGSLTVKAGNTLNAVNSAGLGFSLGVTGNLTLEDNATINWARTPSFNFGGDLQIRDGGTLRGTGTVNVPEGPLGYELQILSGGTVAPGFSTGILNVGTVSTADDTAIIFNSGSTLEIELNGNVAGTEYDQLNVTGEVTLGGATLDVVLDYVAADGDKIFIILNDGSDAINGTFDGLSEGALVDLGTYYGEPASALISYLGDSSSGLIGAGNDVVLYNFDVSGPVPEPSTFVLLGLGIVAMLRGRRSRRQRK